MLAPRRRDAFLTDFRLDPWPKWTFRFPDGTRVEQEIFVHQTTGLTALAWKLLDPARRSRCLPAGDCAPSSPGRDYHALHHENPAFRLRPRFAWNPAATASCGNPTTACPACASGAAARTGTRPPGTATSSTPRNAPAAWTTPKTSPFPASSPATSKTRAPPPCSWRGGRPHARPDAPPRRRSPRAWTPPSSCPPCATTSSAAAASCATPLRRAGDAYLVRGGRGTTIVAGYPWFTDWGRDTFISMRGLCLAAGRFPEARDLLLQLVQLGLRGDAPQPLPRRRRGPRVQHGRRRPLVHRRRARLPPPRPRARRGQAAWNAGRATREPSSPPAKPSSPATPPGRAYGIRLDEDDGLLFAGEPGGTTALTWMDARVDNRPITPRVGKPVEIQALWLNCPLPHVRQLPPLAACSTKRATPPSRRQILARGTRLPLRRDRPGRTARRPRRQPAAQPGLRGGRPARGPPAARAGPPDAQHGGRPAPHAPRPEDPGPLRRGLLPPATRAVRRNATRPTTRGTVWPWLLGPFVEAVVRVNGDTRAARAEARAKYLDPLLALLPDSRGLNHLPEIADAEPPHAPKGCPFQAWSMGELTRLALGVLK